MRYSVSYVNIWIAGVLRLGLATLASSYRKMLVTPNPTIGTWFESFMRGNKNQTRSIKIQSFGLSGEVAHTVLEYLEEYWVRIKPH